MALAENYVPRGTMLGPYEVGTRLAEGAMAVIYTGRHQTTNARVAIKVMRDLAAKNDELLARFRRETQVMGRIAGAATVVQIYDAGQLPDGRSYLVMEFLFGTDLRRELLDLGRRSETINVHRVCRIGRDVARGLQRAHDAGIVHRDVKPENIVLQEDGDQEVAKVIDFGVSADLKPEPRNAQDAPLTTLGAPIGTPYYMAPEQAAGFPAQPGFDIYGLGVVLYEALTGNLPPRQKHEPVAIVDVATIRPGEIPQGLNDLVRDCLTYDATRRIASAGEVAKRLDAVLEDEALEKREVKRWASGRPNAASGGFEPIPLALGGAVNVVGTPEATPHSAPKSKSNGPAVAVGVAALLLVTGLGLGRWFYTSLRVSPGETATPAAAALVEPTTPSEPPPSASQPRVAKVKEPAAELVAKPEPSADPIPQALPGPASDQAPAEPEPVEVAQPKPVAEAPKRDPARQAVRTKQSKRRKPKDNPQAQQPEPTPPAADDKCEATRKATKEARARRRWKTVLTHTRQSCWPASKRAALRVEAYFNLGQLRECAQEARKSSERLAVDYGNACREQLKG